MRAGPIVGGVILLVFGVAIAIGGAPVYGMGETASNYEPEAGAMMSSLGMAMMWGGGLLSLAGIGLLVAGVLAAPKPPKPAPVAVPVQAATRPCPQCSAGVPTDAKYCGACGAAIAPVKPRAQ